MQTKLEKALELSKTHQVTNNSYFKITFFIFFFFQYLSFFVDEGE